MKLQDGHRSGKPADSGSPRQTQGAFCISTGNKTIGNLSLAELKKLLLLLQQLPGRFTMADQQTDREEEEEIVMQQDTIISEDEATPVTFYSMYSNTCEIQMATYPQIKKIVESLQTLLERCRENTCPEKQLSADPDYPIQIGQARPDQTKAPMFKEPIHINRRTTFSADQQKLITHYRFSVNEQYTDWLTAAQLLALHQQLKAFLKNCP